MECPLFADPEPTDVRTLLSVVAPGRHAVIDADELRRRPGNGQGVT
jgi:hypothetical protein